MPCMTGSRKVWEMPAAACRGALWERGGFGKSWGQPRASIPCQLASYWAGPSCALKGGKKRADGAGTALRWN